MTSVRVIAVSPGDVSEEREAIARVVEETNRVHARTLGFSLELWRWETDAYPAFHAEGPQGTIDELMEIADSDLVVGVFWKRFGTPTNDSPSGTEHELTNAWRSWESQNHPQVMVYFNQAPATPSSRPETDQWGRVLDFRDRFPKEGLWWPYIGSSDFERKFREHLQRFLNQLVKSGGTQRKSLAGSFEIPILSDAIPRESLWQTLHRAVQEYPVVVLGGLSGSGKTYLAASYLKSAVAHPRHTYWYDPSEGESIDNLLALFSAQFSLPGASAAARCRALASLLREEGALLVIDNYQLVDTSSYSQLLEAVARSGPPCRLLVMSQVFVEPAPLTSSHQPFHIAVRGFSSDETVALLNRRGLHALSEAVANELIEKTGGLPFAVGLFALLVADFGYDPVDLLSGTMEDATRIKTWFGRVVASISADGRRLLPYLCLDDYPFNIGVVRLLARHLDITIEPFDELQRRYLVVNYSPFRWRIHDLVGHLSRSTLDATASDAAHSLLGRYFLRGLPRQHSAILTDEQFIWKVRAIRHLLRSHQDVKLATAVLSELAATAKARGHYQLFIQLSGDLLHGSTSAARWIVYHHAHCSLVLGQSAYCLRLIEAQIYQPSVIADPVQRLAFTRLYSEALGSLQQEADAIKTLRTAIEASDAVRVGAVPVAQAQSVLVWLLTRSGEFDEAARMSDHLLVDAERRKDERGGAVALARRGAIELFRNQNDPGAGMSWLRNSVDLFRRVRDRRGEAWTLTMLTECYVSLGDFEHARDAFKEARMIAADIGECGVDYRDFVARQRTATGDSVLHAMLKEETERLEMALRWSPPQIRQ